MVTSQQDKFRKAVKYCHNKSYFHRCMSRRLKVKEEKSRFGLGIVKKTGNKIRAFGIGYLKVG